MIQILNNLLYLFAGMLLGWFFGWSRNTILEVKRVAKRLERKIDETRSRIPQQRKPRVRNDRGWYTHKISLIVVLVLTAGAAIWTGMVNNKVAHSQYCTEHTFSRVITTLNDRTAATTDVNIADTAQSEAFATLLTRLLDTTKPPSESEKILLSQDYLTKLVTYNKAKAERDQSTDFPTREEYKKCLEGN